MKTRWRIVLIIFLSALGLLMAVMVAVTVYLTPSRLTSLVNRYASQYLEASVSISRATTHLLRDFPDITAELDNGKILVPAPDSTGKWADTLLAFRKMEVSLRPSALLLHKIFIPRLHLEQAVIHLFTDKQDRSNWDIFPEPEDTLSPSYGLSIGRLSVSDTLRFTYHDYKDTVYYSVGIENMTARAPFRSGGYNADIKSFSNTLIVGENLLFDRIPFLVRGGITLENIFDDYYFKDCETVLGKVPLYINGFMGLHEDSLELRGVCRIDSAGLADIYDAIPLNLLPREKPFESSLPLKDVVVILNGAYNYQSGEFPVFSARLTAGPGSFMHLPTGIMIPEIQAGITSSYDPLKGNHGSLEIKGMEVRSPALDLSLNGILSSVLKEPAVKLTAGLEVRLDHLSDLVKGITKGQATGEVLADLEADFRFKDLTPAALGNIMLRGSFLTEGFTLDLPSYSLFCRADATRVFLGISPGTSLDLEAGSDSLQIRYKGRELAALSGTELKAGSTPGMFTMDSTKVQPLSGSLKSRNLQVYVNDSTRIGMGNGHVVFRVTPDSRDQSLPVIGLTLESGSAGAIMGVHRGRISDLHLQADLSRNIRPQRRDTTGLSARREAFLLRRTRPRHEFSYADLSLDLDKEERGLLRRWNVNGTLQAGQIQFATPYIPLNTEVNDAHLVLQNDRLEIANTVIRAGRSDLLLNGYMTDIRRVLLGRGRLGLNFDLQSDTLDCNELIGAISSGMFSMNEPDSLADSLEIPVYQNLLIVPGNVNLQLVLAVSNAYYRHLQMKGLHGMLRAADRYLQLDELQASSNAGDITIDALYATPDKDSLNVGLNMEMKDILLEEVTRLFPSIDTLFPMIRSFRGLADIQFSATSQLDTSMNLILSTLQGACRISGNGLVLLDGETFSEISRKLMFRKKALNLIESIRVEATVADNRVDVYPFIMEMDRYRAAIAGSHNMDGTFHYHISLLKSPVPFKFGIDVLGVPGDYKIDLGRARFTDQGIPALSYRIDSIRVNLREQIRKYFENYSFE
ncbi:MAG TPA: AsmA family protein [Bacteroidales bacterium]|nr:AsmA family protein [Bacteroidales bacterium]